MSNFKMQKIGTYDFGVTKTGNPMLHLDIDPELYLKIKEWDRKKIYIYSPNKNGGDIMGLIDSEQNT